jgi:hypothetical protein
MASGVGQASPDRFPYPADLQKRAFVSMPVDVCPEDGRVLTILA